MLVYFPPTLCWLAGHMGRLTCPKSQLCCLEEPRSEPVLGLALPSPRLP